MSPSLLVKAMAVGFGLLRLSSRDFWAMTPRELSAALRLYPVDVTPPGRTDLAGLMRRFPDQPTTTQRKDQHAGPV